MADPGDDQPDATDDSLSENDGDSAAAWTRPEWDRMWRPSMWLRKPAHQQGMHVWHIVAIVGLTVSEGSDRRVTSAVPTGTELGQARSNVLLRPQQMLSLIDLVANSGYSGGASGRLFGQG